MNILKSLGKFLFLILGGIIKLIITILGSLLGVSSKSESSNKKPKSACSSSNKEMFKRQIEGLQVTIKSCQRDIEHERETIRVNKNNPNYNVAYHKSIIESRKRTIENCRQNIAIARERMRQER